MILIDTREQKYSHITEWFDVNGIKYDRSKLYVGDYQVANDGRISIDRKHNMQEVYCNVISEHERFRAELIRARDADCKLVILVEDPNIRFLYDVSGWKNPRYYVWLKDKSRPKPTDSETVMKIMARTSERYGCEWTFCRKEETARRIVEILQPEAIQ